MATPHILLVDDSCVDRLVASRLLRSCNIRVTAMEGPKQALKFLYMKSPRFNHLPVVIACTEDILERIKKCLDGGAKDYVIKPIKVVNVPYLLSYI
ncbi:hypothetical protein SETIT_1G318300v2 [Setaria italica]|uniref:Response regulatory domain-containing protein n=1 Tax=Setaria italica TaxID=4555 RepID=A0A368PRU2_SETIT|nr:hypothetical protein SETIT_1G318300v2 [Setaria italica]